MPILDVPGVGRFDLPENSTPEQINQFVSDLNESRTALQPQSTKDYLQRQAGLMTRAVINPVTTGAAIGAAAGAPLAGVGAIPGALAGATAGAVTDIAPRIYNTIAGMVGASGRLPALGDVLERIKNEAGLPSPITPEEKIAQAAVEGASSAVSTLGAGQAALQSGRPIMRAIGNILTERPALQTGQGIIGGLASEAARQAGAGPVGQMVAGVGAAGIPAIATGGEQALKTIARGGAKPSEILGNIRAFGDVGLTPSAGQATQATPIKAVEASMGKVPFSYDVMRDFGTSQQKVLQERLKGIAEELSLVTEPSVAGAGIKEGVPKVFGQKRLVESRLYRNLDQLLPAKTQTKLDNFKTTLDEITGGIKGAPALSEQFQNPKIASIKNAFDADVNKKTGTLSLEAVKKIRSEIGEALSGIKILNDVPRREYKMLYGALSEDMKNIAAQKGPDALRAFNRANAYSKALHERADRLQSFIQKIEPEAVYQATISGAKSGGTRIAAVMKSIPVEDQKAVTTAFVDRMGKALPGQQTDIGDAWSSNTFLTNWNKLSNPAKQQLFGRYGSSFMKDMEKIARASSLIRSGGNVLANPSGTAAGLAPVATAVALASSAGAGKFGVAKGIVGFVGSSYLGSKLFTNPKYVRWLAKNVDITPNQVPAAVMDLQTIANDEDDPNLDAVAKMMKASAIQNSLGK